MSYLTVCYITSRREPRIEWFFDSLERQWGSDQDKIIVVDRHTQEQFNTDRIEVDSMMGKFIHCAPKPNVWSGPHRLTTEDYFSAANARNTAAALCETDWIAYVDDLSVLGPHWLQSVREAMAGNYIALGAYQKVRKLVVENGVPVSFDPYPQGIDNRLANVDSDVTPCGGRWCYGCSLALPMEWLLTVGGFPEFVDGMGFEDVLFGYALMNNGFPLRYDRRMMTLESEEDHHVEPAMKRIDKGKSPNDKSHAALNMLLNGQKYFANYYEGGLRALRDRMLAGGEWPTDQNPQNDWYDGQLISEM